MRRDVLRRQAIQFVFVLVVLFVAIAVVIGVGTALWPVSPEVLEAGSPKKEYSISEKTDVIDVFAKEQGLSRMDWPQELVDLLARNRDTEEFVLNYPLKKDIAYEIDLTECLNGETVPLFYQWDERWGYTIYGSNVMGLTGCGPTCLSMVLVHLLQDATYTPRYVADFAEKNRYYVEGSGSKWTLISEGGKTLGLDVTELPLDENRMKKHLEQGNPIICIMGPGDFTTAGHYIVLRGIQDGSFVVNDPNSKINSERLWSYEELQGQIKNLWACRKPE